MKPPLQLTQMEAAGSNRRAKGNNTYAACAVRAGSPDSFRKTIIMVAPKPSRARHNGTPEKEFEERCWREREQLPRFPDSTED